MNIFDKRPLSLILCIMLGGFVAFCRDSKLLRFSALLIAILLLIIFAFFKYKGKTKAILAICSATLLISSLCSYIYFDLWFKADKRFDDEVEIYGKIESISYSDYRTSYIIKTFSVNEKPISSYRLLLRLDNDVATSYSEGSQLKLKGELKGFEASTDFDAQAYYFSRGISAEIVNDSDIVTMGNGSIGLASKLSMVREYLRRYACTLSDGDAGTVLAALMLGERDMLSEQLKLDFRRIGITHVLALSGMHLAIIALGISKLLSMLGVNKKIRTIITIGFTVIYMVLVGLPVSVVRAGLMLIIASLLFLFSKTSDSITSLLLAVTAICIITPYAIYDISLWLSSLATFGILIFSEYYNTVFKLATTTFEKIKKCICTAFMTSIFAILATFLISIISFGAISIFSPISTIVFSVLVEAILYVGGIMLILGKLIPVGKLLIPIVDLTKQLSESISTCRFAYSTADTPLIRVLVILLTIALVSFAVLRIKRKKVFVSALTSGVLSILLLVAFNAVSTNNYNSASYYSAEKCDSIVLKSHMQTSYINSSQYSRGNAYDSVDYLTDENIYYLDNYVLTHYSWNMTEDLEIMLSNFPIENIYIPVPKNDDEDAILARVTKIISDFRSRILLVNINDVFELGECQASILYSTPYGEGTSTNSFELNFGDKKLIYLSSGMMSQNNSKELEDVVAGSDVVIHGAHGKKYSDGYAISKFYENNKSIILSGGYIYLTQQAYIQYTENGCEIYSHPSYVKIDLFSD